ncbi:MAG: hypothetical protein ACYTEQ_26205 [Planctomycetota bacterium]|jgi:hypothetical protein
MKFEINKKRFVSKIKKRFEDKELQLKIQNAFLEEAKKLQAQMIAEVFCVPYKTWIEPRPSISARDFMQSLRHMETQLIVEREIAHLRISRILYQIEIRHWRRLRAVAILEASIKARKN